MKMYSKTILLLTWVVVVNSQQSLGTTPATRRTTLINFSTQGKQVLPGEWPHHVLIFKLTDVDKNQYQSFCAGSLISAERVLSSSNCFLTNKKNPRHDYKKIWLAAGVVKTELTKRNNTSIRQFRQIAKLYSQRLYRYPAYNIAILVVDKPFIFTEYVKSIPYESLFHDFDGVCVSVTVKATKSWAFRKYVYTEPVQMVPRKKCEAIFLRNLRHYFCTETKSSDNLVYAEAQGGGLVCQITGDPKEVNETQGLLVGVTSVINVGVPSLHAKIGIYSKWIEDKSCTHNSIRNLLKLCIAIIVLNR